MTTFIREMSCKGYETRTMSICHIKELCYDIQRLKTDNHIDEQIFEFVTGFYNFELPDVGFDIRSIIVVASRCPMTRVFFNRGGKRSGYIIPPTYIDYAIEPELIEKELNEILGREGYRLQRARRLPEKLMAVRSGLCAYGRNNISYVPGMGSFALISAYFSDMHCIEDNWTDIRVMEACRSCSVCINKCPTGAISKDSFLISAKRCITYYNESSGKADFPEWLDPSLHNCLIGCLCCQNSCPQNREYVNNIVDSVEFDEAETALILSGTERTELPQGTVSKLKQINMDHDFYYTFLPRNLKVLMDKEGRP